jgi:hypothetical protein
MGYQYNEVNFGPGLRRRALSAFQLILSACIAFAASSSVASGAQPRIAGADNAWQQEELNASKLDVALEFKNGRPVVNREASSLSPSPRFLKRLRISPEEAKKLLCDDLDEFFQKFAPPYRYALGADEKKLDAENRLNDAETALLRVFSGPWQKYQEIFRHWAAGPPQRCQFEEVFSTLPLCSLGEDPAESSIFSEFSLLHTTTALSWDEGGDDLWDPAAGRAVFTVIDPIGDWRSAEYQIVFPDSAGGRLLASTEEIMRQLQPLAGHLWRKKEIIERLQDYYQKFGLAAIITPSTALETIKSIEIIEGFRIARIIFPKSVSDPVEQDKILYYLLDDSDFRLFDDKRALIFPPVTSASTEAAPDADFLFVDYVAHLGRKPRTEPYLYNKRITIQRLLLAGVGYAVEPIGTLARPSDMRKTYVDLVVKKMVKLQEAPPEPPARSNTLLSADNQGLIDSNRMAGEPAPFPPSNAAAPNLSPSGAERLNQMAVERQRDNFLGGGLEYRPGQGVRGYGLYQRAHLLGAGSNDKFSIKLGGHGKALGDINYFTDFAFFSRLRRRLSLRLTGSSDFTARRTLDGVPTDERRSGGLARAELEWFRDRAGHLLRFYAEARHTTVSLRQNEQTAGNQNLNTVEFGSLYIYEASETKSPRIARIETGLRFGMGLARQEPVFRRFTLKGELRQELPRQLELKFNGRVEAASRQTPLFEQPSLGGADILRGFRSDAAIGRSMWSLQNELQFPVPGLKSGDEKLKKLLRNNFKLATFIDVGGAYQTTGARAGLRAGPGVGLRFIYFPMELGLDWAYGLGKETVAVSSKGRFSLSVKTVLPF